MPLCNRKKLTDLVVEEIPLKGEVKKKANRPGFILKEEYDLGGYKPEDLTKDCFASESYKNTSCLAEDTMIDTPKGQVPIQHLEPGDPIYSFNEKTKRIEVSKVLSKTEHEKQIVCHLRLSNGASVRATPNHVFYNSGYLTFGMHDDPQSSNIGYKTWVTPLALRLKGNDYFFVKHGKSVKGILYHSVEVERKPVRVYDIEVDKNHNYFSNGILVHNKEAGPG